MNSDEIAMRAPIRWGKPEPKYPFHKLERVGQFFICMAEWSNDRALRQSASIYSRDHAVRLSVRKHPLGWKVERLEIGAPNPGPGFDPNKVAETPRKERRRRMIAETAARHKAIAEAAMARAQAEADPEDDGLVRL